MQGGAVNLQPSIPMCDKPAALISEARRRSKRENIEIPSPDARVCCSGQGVPGLIRKVRQIASTVRNDAPEETGEHQEDNRQNADRERPPRE